MPAAVRTIAGSSSDERSPVAHVATTSAPNGGKSTRCVIHEACGANAGWPGSPVPRLRNPAIGLGGRITLFCFTPSRSAISFGIE